jgi:putative hydrolase of the HAD superfamily
MIPIFDLDDTLFQERCFVESGFRAVAVELRQLFGWPIEISLQHMNDTLAIEGRGAVFNRLLNAGGVLKAKYIHHCINIYRHHKPEIELTTSARRLLTSMKSRPYLVTDGHKIVQRNKVKALGIEPLFQRIYITHRYGICHAKPSVYCFELIRKLERCAWSDMFYVGDNPAKDFVNLNPLGVHTIRVLTGEYASVVAKEGFDAKYKINSLNELQSVLKEIS